MPDYTQRCQTTTLIMILISDPSKKEHFCSSQILNKKSLQNSTNSKNSKIKKSKMLILLTIKKSKQSKLFVLLILWLIELVIKVVFVFFNTLRHLHKTGNGITAIWARTMPSLSEYHWPLLRKDAWVPSQLIKKSKQSKCLILLILWLIEQVILVVSFFF